MQLTKNGLPKTYSVHRLVAEAFIPNPLGKPTVNHLDGDKLNNDVTNLEWATYSENVCHAFEHGLSKPKLGEENHRAILFDREINKIRREFMDSDITQVELARKYSVSPTTVSQIISGDVWGHIDKPLGPVFNKSKGVTSLRWVHYHRGRYRGRFTHNGKKYCCGLYNSARDAYDAVKKKRLELGVGNL